MLLEETDEDDKNSSISDLPRKGEPRNRNLKLDKPSTFSYQHKNRQGSVEKRLSQNKILSNDDESDQDWLNTEKEGNSEDDLCSVSSWDPSQEDESEV